MIPSDQRRVPWPVALLLLAAACGGATTEFQSRIPDAVTRPWIGPDYYANRLQTVEGVRPTTDESAVLRITLPR